MKLISTRIHGYIDYIMGVILIVAPWIFDFAPRGEEAGAETWVPVLLGIGTILYSLLTDYELGVKHMIPMRTHLTLDIVAGLLLAASPWLFGFADYIWQPHLILGIIAVGAALMTRREQGERRTPVDRNIQHRTATGH
jgi:hypothetical protein